MGTVLRFTSVPERVQVHIMLGHQSKTKKWDRDQKLKKIGVGMSGSAGRGRWIEGADVVNECLGWTHGMEKPFELSASIGRRKNVHVLVIHGLELELESSWPSHQKALAAVALGAEHASTSYIIFRWGLVVVTSKIDIHNGRDQIGCCRRTFLVPALTFPDNDAIDTCILTRTGADRHIFASLTFQANWMPPTSGICVAGCAQVVESVQIHGLQIWTALLLPNLGCGRRSPHLSVHPQRAAQGSYVQRLRGEWKLEIRGAGTLQTEDAGLGYWDPRGKVIATSANSGYHSSMLSNISLVTLLWQCEVWWQTRSLTHKHGMCVCHQQWWLPSLMTLPVELRSCAVEMMPLFLSVRAPLLCHRASRHNPRSCIAPKQMYNCSGHSHPLLPDMFHCSDWCFCIWKQMFVYYRPTKHYLQLLR